MYGSFNCIIFDHAVVHPKVLRRSGEFVYHGPSTSSEPSPQMFPCSLWGPTCDSMDCLTKEASLPLLHPGDWLVFENMGAYTLSAASTLYFLLTPPYSCDFVAMGSRHQACYTPTLIGGNHENKLFIECISLFIPSSRCKVLMDEWSRYSCILQRSHRRNRA